MEQVSQTEYTLTVHADKEFLEAETTVYPVVVDPSVTVELSGTINGKQYIEDSFVYSSATSTNYGSNTVLFGSTTRTIFMKFPGLSEDQQMVLVQGSKIARFYLRFYSTGASTNASTASYSVYNVNATWNESTITYNNKPSCGSSSLSTASVTGTAGYKTIDISNAARQWTTISHKGAYYGVKLTFTGSMKFYSSEVATASYKPYLQINYDATGEGIYSISNTQGNTKKYIGFENDYADEDSAVIGTTLGSNDFAKEFRISYVSSEDAYTIRPLASKNGYRLYLKRSGSNLVLSSSADYFQLVHNSDGSYAIVDDNDDEYVTLSGNNIAMGSNGTLASQKWNLIWSDRNEAYAYYRGLNFSLPLANSKVNSRYGVRDRYENGNYSNHFAVDLIRRDGATTNVPVVSVSSGTIVRNNSDPDGYGYYVVVDTGLEAPDDSGRHLYVLYAHLASKPTYATDTSIDQGDTIGIMGNTGDSDGPHLHIAFYLCDPNKFTSSGSSMTYENTIDPRVFYAQNTFD